MTTKPYIEQDNLFLAIDQGGHASRALVFDQNGVMVAQAYEAIHINQPEPDWVEHDAEELVQSVLQSVKQVVQQLGSRANKIVAAGLATQRSSIACWDKDSGAALAPIISWQDRRAHHWLESFSHQAQGIHKKTGLFLSAHYGASKLHWCLQHIPAVKQAHEQGRLAFGPMASFLIYRLCRERPFVVDPANASRTQLWNLKQLDWDLELLELFDIPRAALPQCVPSCYDYGELDLENVAIPLKVVNGDQSAAMYAFGHVQPDTAYINTGTGAFVSRPLGLLRAYGRRLLTSIILQDRSEATYVLEGTVNGAGSALDWVSEELGLGGLYEELPMWLVQCQTPPLFLNGISGLGAPYWIPDFPSHFEGKGEPWEKVVAVVESIVFLLQENLEEMLKLASPPQQIQISGGLATLDGLCQKLADLTGLPVYRPDEREATGRGLAYLLAGRPKLWPEADIGVWFKPQENSSLYKRYHHWRDAMHTQMRRQKTA